MCPLASSPKAVIEPAVRPVARRSRACPRLSFTDSIWGRHKSPNR
jgi:hypothetical protein